MQGSRVHRNLKIAVGGFAHDPPKERFQTRISGGSFFHMAAVESSFRVYRASIDRRVSSSKIAGLLAEFRV